MSDARSLWIPGPAGRLAAALRLACPSRATAVLAHPHPLHGGTMHNPVVFHSDRELNRAGLTTVRFDFRGVGTSDGAHTGGPGEVEDVAAAAAWAAGLDRRSPLLLVGYSFGSWCAVQHAVRDEVVDAVVAIGLPVRRYGFEDLGRLRRPFAVVQAANDEFGTPTEIQPLLERLQPPGELFVVDGTAHLFPGRARDAASGAVAATRSLLAALEDGG